VTIFNDPFVIMLSVVVSGLGLARKYKTIIERLARGKHSSLFARDIVNDTEECFITLSPGVADV
jgi:hypothetical protein